MSKIIDVNGAPLAPEPNDNNMPPIGINADGNVVMSSAMWMTVQDRLRKCDAFLQALVTVCRQRPDCTLKIDVAALAKSWEDGYGLDFHPSENGQQMIFTAKQNIKLEKN